MEKNDQISELLTRGVAEIIDSEQLGKRLRSGEKLRIKLGIDPTSPNLHLGRAVPLLKLRDFQKLGHQIVFIIGDFTGVIGDTSDKNVERPMLDRDVVEKNLKTYAQQAGKILDMDKVELRRNSEWLTGIGYQEICDQANQFSLAEFMARKNIRTRYEKGNRISLRELMYPLMQGYDSVAVEADVELGGTDQKFNLLAGRTLQERYKQKPQDILTMNIIEGLDGRKMSSSWGNTINLMDEPEEMYGKVMSMKDELIYIYFVHCTRLPMEEVSGYQKQLEDGKNPRDIKMKLAYEITRMYWGEDGAQIGAEHFQNVVQNKELPDDIDELAPKSYNIIEVLVESNLASSKSNARRLIEQKAVKVDGESITDISIDVQKDSIVQKGKRGFVKIM